MTEATVANNSNGVISKAGNAVMATRGVKILGGPDPTGPPINPSNKMGLQVKNFVHPLIQLYFGSFSLVSVPVRSAVIHL